MSSSPQGHRTGPWTTAASVNITHAGAFLSLLSNAMLLAVLFAAKKERNKFFLGTSQNTFLLSSSSPVVNPFCCQGASCQLPVTFLAKWRANDSTVLINTLHGRHNENPKVDNDNN